MLTTLDALRARISQPRFIALRSLAVTALSLAFSGCAAADADGGLYFADGVCIEHEIVLGCSPLGETCGCEASQGCRPLGPGARMCSPAGAAPQGERCVSHGDCQRDAWCVSGVCRDVCDLHPEGLPCAQGPCAWIAVGGENISDLGVCSDDGCDPVAQSGCDPGLACRPGRAQEGAYSACNADVDGAGLRDRCDDGACAPGLVCVSDPPGEPRACRAFCDVTDDATCATSGEARCSGRFGAPWIVVGRELGFCDR